MIILLLILSFIIGLVFTWLYNNVNYANMEDTCFAFAAIGWGVFSIMVIAGLCVGGAYVDSGYADERLEVIRVKNQEVEEGIQFAVKSYMEHEGKTYTEMAPNEALAVVQTYPELSSNELVKDQIETYKENREQILKYEQSKVTRKVLAWWLWFGNN